MTPEQALNILDQLRLQTSMTGSNHETTKQAVEVLAAAIAENQPEVP